MGIFFLKQLARLPFWLLYLLSNLIYIVVFYGIGYRKKVINENLKNAFPEKSEGEIRQIIKRFYRHFSELTIEIIKHGSMKEADFKKRMVLINPELPNRYFDEKKSIVILTLHYNNWEWSSSFSRYLKHKPLGVYKPLHNKKYNNYLNINRSRMGVEMIPNNHVLKQVIKSREKDETILLWLAGDQTPPLYHTFWLRFLNQDTLFYPGPASISRRFKYPVFFQKTIKTGRGHYETSFELLMEDPENYSEAGIMKAYIQKMEETIREQPEYYLWSHKRWKHKRPTDVSLHE